MSPQPPPVGKRPMLDDVTMNRLIEYARLPERDLVSPDGQLHLECYGRFRATDRSLFRSRERRGQNAMSVQVGESPTPNGDLMVAIVSYPNHMASWGEVKRVRETVFPAEMDVMLPLPGSDTHYINDHPYALWLWEMPARWGWPSMSPTEALTLIGGRIHHGEG